MCYLKQNTNVQVKYKIKSISNLPTLKLWMRRQEAELYFVLALHEKLSFYTNFECTKLEVLTNVQLFSMK